MADNSPTVPGGAMPPKPVESAKVQPKKETVRINLPPKPTSAPTIKLPTLAPGAPSPASAAAAPASSTAAATLAAFKTAGAPASPALSKAAPAKQTAAPPPPPRHAAPAAMGLTGLDKGLAIAAAVVSLAALGCVLYLAFFLKDTVAS